jgi:hypothetical protein
MPKMVSEVPAGREYQFTGKQGELAVSTNRIFRIIRLSPDEFIDLPVACNIRVGDAHPNPQLSLLRCTNYQAQVEGEGRMVILATFTYELQNPYGGEDGGQGSSGGGGRLELNPEIRWAEWSVSSSLMEVPAYTWQNVTALDGSFGSAVPAANPAGDRYDGVTRTEPIVTISIQQFEKQDPTKYLQHLGKTNQGEAKIGSLVCQRRSLMFRDLQFRSTSEQYGALLYRGYDVTYQFVYRRNHVKGISIGGVQQEMNMGWDIAVPQTGFNVRAFTPPGNNAIDDTYGQPLKHAGGKIGFDGGQPLLPLGVSDGDKVKAMVKVFEYEDGGVSQAPSAQPVAMNDNGRPRKLTATPPVLVKQYKVTDEADFSQIFAHIRLRP